MRLTDDEIRCPECSRVVRISDEGLCEHRNPVCADGCCETWHWPQVYDVPADVDAAYADWLRMGMTA